MKHIIILFLTVIISEHVSLAEENKKLNCNLWSYDGYCIVTIFKLISRPEEYSGQKIAVVGVGSIVFESEAIFTDYSSFKQFIPFNSISLQLTSIQIKKNGWMTGKYLLIKGDFTYPEKSMKNSNGVLDNIIEIKRVGVNE